MLTFSFIEPDIHAGEKFFTLRILSSNRLQVSHQSRSINFFDESSSQRSQEGVRYSFSFMVCQLRKVLTVTFLLAYLDKLEVTGVELVGNLIVVNCSYFDMQANQLGYMVRHLVVTYEFVFINYL